MLVCRGITARCIALAFVAVGLAAVSSPVQAGFITTTLASAGPGNWAVLGLSQTDVSLTGPGVTTGNVGVSSGGKLSLSGGVTVNGNPTNIIGNVYLGNTATIDHAERVVGTVYTNQNTFLNQANADANNAASVFSGLANTFTVAGNNIDTNLTLTATQALNVTHIVDLSLNHEDLTLVGTAAQEFVINISGKFEIGGDNSQADGSGKILLSGGITPDNVIFNITGTGSDVKAGGGSSDDVPNAQINALILTLQRKIAFAPGLVNGEIIGGGDSISLVSGSQAEGALPAVPEPASMAIWTLGALGCAIAGYRRRRLP